LRSFSKIGLLVSAAMLAMSSAAFGAGFGLFEQGAKATAMGGAFAATADDPSAIFYNVAGIAQQRHTTFLAGGTLINFNNEFTGDPTDAFTSGATGQYRAHTFVPPNSYLIMPIGTNLTVGVGIFTPFGLRTNWEDPWIGRFVSRDANIKTVSVQHSIAWQTTSGNLAIGFGAEYRRARVVLVRNSTFPPGSVNVNPFLGRFPDLATAYLSSDWDNAWGWNAGVLFKPAPTWRIGASYRAPMDIDFKGDVTITPISTGNPQLDAQIKLGLPPSQPVTTTINFPSISNIGIATTAIPNWDLEFDLVHTTWSRFKQLKVNFLTTPLFGFTRDQNWDDSNSYRFGANRTINPTWDVRFGLVYDRTPQPIENVSPLLPDSDREGASFGIGWHHGPWIVDATEFALHFKKRSTNGGLSSPETNFNGTYHTDANLISLNLGYRF
jgi:long-chain fatty acid transport protein